MCKMTYDMGTAVIGLIYHAKGPAETLKAFKELFANLL